MPNPKTVLLIYGDGGHKKEMELFLATLPADHDLQFISLGPVPLNVPVVAHFNGHDVRDKQNRRKSLSMATKGMFHLVWLTLRLKWRFRIMGAVSTGPGIALVPFAALRLLATKTVFIESFCRFHSRSITGRIMYRLANRFLVQNRELCQLYPKAEYCGRL